MTPQDGWKQEADDLDSVLRLIGLDPQACRTDGGSLNIGRVRAALAALRSMPAEPVAERIITAYMVDGRGAFIDFNDGKREFYKVEVDHEIPDDCATPPPAPVLLTDAEIDAITLSQWGDRVLLAAYRAYARAIEQSVIARGRGEL